MNVTHQEAAHFMRKEIQEQPQVIRACSETLAIASTWQGQTIPAALEFPTTVYQVLEHIRFIACGTSLHACQVAKILMEQLARLPVTVHSAAELQDALPPLLPHALTIAVTQSGETADVLAALNQLQQLPRSTASDLPIQFLGITNQSGSALEQMVQQTWYTPAGPEISVAATKTFTATLMLLYGLALNLAWYRQTVPMDTIAKILVGLHQLPTQLEQVIEEQESAIVQVATMWTDLQSCILLGQGITVPIALEGALKLKETTYIHAEGFALGEFMHGPIALLDETIPVVAIAGIPPFSEFQLAKFSKLKARGSPLISLVSGTDDRTPLACFDRVWNLPTVQALLLPFMTVVPLQLLAYHAAVKRGLNPDRPRGLKKFLST